MIFLGLAGLITKLYKPSESNMLFDGGSLVLYVCGVIVYGANIIKGLRIVTLGTYGVGLEEEHVVDGSRGNVLGREDNLKVLSASHTILALVLVGVLILQAGQWYAERADEKEKVKMMEQEEREREMEGREEGEEVVVASSAVGGGGGGGGGGSRRASGKEGKKSK